MELCLVREMFGGRMIESCRKVVERSKFEASFFPETCDIICR